MVARLIFHDAQDTTSAVVTTAQTNSSKKESGNQVEEVRDLEKEKKGRIRQKKAVQKLQRNSPTYTSIPFAGQTTNQR